MNVASWEASELRSDNDALRRRLAALELEAQRAEAILRSNHEAVVSTDGNAIVERMNRVAEALTGWTEAEAKGHPADEVVHLVSEDTHARVESPIARVLREGEDVALANHTLLIARDGTSHPIADSGATIRNAAGQVTGAVLVFRDQTAERHAEASVRIAEQQFRTFFDNAPIGKSMTSPSGRLLRVNAALGRLLGYSLEELQALSFASITHPDDLPESVECVRALLAGERETWTMDKRYLAKDGRAIWTHVTTRLLRDDSGAPLHFLTHIQDISERKAAEKHRAHLEELVAQRSAEIKESQAALVEAQRLARVGSWGWDAVGDAITGSQEFYRLFDAGPEELARFDQFIDRLHPDDRRPVQQAVADAMGKGVPYDIDYRVELRDGSRRDINARGRVFTDAAGAPIRMVGTCQDITERKQIEAALGDSEQQHRGVFDSPLTGILFWNATGEISAANDKFLEIVGYSRHDLETHQINWRAMTPPEYLAKDAELLRELAATGTMRPIEKEYLRKDGRRVPIIICAATLDGAQHKGVALIIDNTERKQIEAALRDSEQQHRGVFESPLTGIVFWNAAGEISAANDKFLQLVGYSRHDLETGQINWRAMTPPEYLARDEELLEMLVTTGSMPPSEKEYVRKDGSRLPIIFTAATLNGDHLKGVAMIMDNTERKQAAEQLQRTNAALARSNKELEQFAYVASHDLQEPLRMVASYTELLAERYRGQLDAKADKFIGYAVDGAKRMQGLISDLLAFSRLGTRGAPLAPVDVNLVVADVLKDLAGAIQDSHAEVVCAELPTVLADRSQLGQVLQNLIGNALKFRGEAPPRVEISATRRGARWAVTVADNGIGIDPQFHDRIFVIFQRLHERGKYPGSGIGLSVVKKIVERHGGVVEVASGDGAGSRFTFTMSAASQPSR